MTRKLVATVGRPYSSIFYALRGGRLVLIGYRRRYPLTIKLPESWISTDPQRWEVHHRRCSRLVLSTDHSAIPHTRAGRVLEPPTRATRAVVSRSNRLLGQTATRAALRNPKVPTRVALHLVRREVNRSLTKIRDENFKSPTALDCRNSGCHEASRILK